MCNKPLEKNNNQCHSCKVHPFVALYLVSVACYCYVSDRPQHIYLKFQIQGNKPKYFTYELKVVSKSSS